MPEIVELIETLIARDHAYESGGDVYFRVRSFPGYGKLSNRDPDQMDQGEEAGSAELKEDPLDFALWKARKHDEDTVWPSPWGEGGPGWHIECSAMAEKFLGADFAIHGGGTDLVFPHHENEIAQTEAARGVPLARIWMHEGMVTTGPEAKMAKSEGNVFLLARGARPLRPRGGRRLPDLGPLPPADRVRRGGARAGACAGNERFATSSASASAMDGDPDEAVVGAPRGASSTPWPTTSTPRGRWPQLFDLVARGPQAGRCRARTRRSRRCSSVLGLERLAEAEEGPPTPRPRRCWPSATRPAPRATSSAPTRCATSWASAATRCATRRRADGSCRRG